MTFISMIFVSLGVLFILLAGVGILRMPTFFMRMQTTSKASTLGVLLIVMGLFIQRPTWEVFLKGGLTCVFLLLTTPVASHALALAAKKRGYDR